MTRLRETAQRWLASGRAAVLVEVTQAKGSVPRQAGTRMLVAREDCTGTIGGGHLELDAIEKARAMLAVGEAARTVPQSVHYPLGPALGQCCGGAVTLGFSMFDAGAIERWPVDPPLFHLQLYGAGHVGRAIVRALAPLNVSVDWIDEREEEFAPTFSIDPATPWPAHIRKVCVDAVEAEVGGAEPGAFYLVLTHRHDLDLKITEAILRRADFAYLGLIGSQTKKQRFIHHFERRGIRADVIERMTCPIGVPGIEGKQPEVIAVAVVAQLLQTLGSRGGTAADTTGIEAPSPVSIASST